MRRWVAWRVAEAAHGEEGAGSSGLLRPLRAFPSPQQRPGFKDTKWRSLRSWTGLPKHGVGGEERREEENEGMGEVMGPKSLGNGNTIIQDGGANGQKETEEKQTAKAAGQRNQLTVWNRGRRRSLGAPGPPVSS